MDAETKKRACTTCLLCLRDTYGYSNWTTIESYPCPVCEGAGLVWRSQDGATHLLRSDVREAIAEIDADCSHGALPGMPPRPPRPLPSIYDILRSTPEQGTDIADALRILRDF